MPLPRSPLGTIHTPIIAFQPSFSRTVMNRLIRMNRINYFQALKTLTLAVALFFAADTAAAQNFAAPYLQFSNSARASGFGEAYVASVDDASATRWNPAGLSQVGQFSVTGVFAEDLELDRSYVSTSAAYSFEDIGTFALSFTNSGVDDIQSFSENNVATGQFDVNNNVLGLSYARELSGGLSLGLTGRYINQNLDVQTDEGLSLDLGAQFRQQNFFAGLALQNVVGEVGPDELDKVLRAGAGGTFQGAIFEIDYVHEDISSSTADDHVNVGLGYEVMIDQVTLGARGGLRQGDLGLGGSLGILVDDRFRFGVDYAFVNDPSEIFDNSHRIGLSIRGTR